MALAVFVLGKNKKPLMPCSEKRARLLLERGRAVVHRRVPFTIRLKDRADGECQPLLLKVDPGSKKTGIALVRVDDKGEDHVVALIELEHRGHLIRDRLVSRSAFRGRRRSANLRHRPARSEEHTSELQSRGHLVCRL